ANDPEGRHEIEVTPPTSIEQRAEDEPGQTATEVLKRINHARGKAGHLRAANVHRRCRPQNRMGRVRSEQDENEKKHRRVNALKLRGEKNDDGFEKIKTGRDRRSPSLKNQIGNVTRKKRTGRSHKWNEKTNELELRRREIDVMHFVHETG